MTKPEKANDFNDLCRVCRKNSNKMVNLFGIRKKGLTLAEMLAICTQSIVQQTDRFPSNVCNQCLANLEIAFDFHKQAKASEERFRQILSADEPANCGVQSIEYCTPQNDDNTNIDQRPKLEAAEEPEIFLSYNVSSEPKLKRKPNNIETKTLEMRAIHLRELHERRMRRLFECFMCKAKLQAFQAMRKHLKRHSEATPFKCKICTMHFTAENYQQHLCKGQSVKCDYCSESFQTTKRLLEHLDGHTAHHNLHKCPDCSKLFPMEFLLNCHRTQQHRRIEKPYTCHICTRAFRLANSLTKHLATHSDDRPHLCSTCGKGFKTMGTLRSHTIRHSENKPVACSKCPRRFFSKADLRKHMDVHTDRKYVCCLCGSVLSSKRSLDEHTRHRHRKAEEQTCDLCFMKFRTIYNLKRHKLTHTGEKPHKCMYCERAFAQSGDLNKHLRSHVGEKTYSCELCDKSFRLQIELRKHSYEHFQNKNTETTQIS